MDLTPERLQDIAVRVVSKFMTKQADLSDAIAAEAKTLELNPEQIKRVIESSNTIAYLRQLEDASDRSFEFPIAEYRDVMGKIILPDAASPTVPTVVAEAPASPPAPKPEVTSSISEQEKVAMLVKETMRVKQTLTKMASEEMIMCFRLDEVASRIQKDPKGIEKLAYVISVEDLNNVKVLCGLEKSASTEGSVFTNAELSDVMSLNSLFKEAKDLLSDKQQKEEFVKRATAVLIEKKAFADIPGATSEAAGTAAGKLGRGIVTGTAGAIKSVGRGVKALTAGKTLGQRVTGAADIGASVMTAANMKHDNPVWKSLHS